MNLFTIIFEFKGGTYVSQVLTKDHNSAMNDWLEKLDLEIIYGLEEADRSELTAKFKEDDNDLVLLEGLTNSWCGSILWGEDMQYIYIIKTVSQIK